MYKMILIVVLALSILLFWIQQLQTSTAAPLSVEPVTKSLQGSTQSASATVGAAVSKWNGATQADLNKPVQLFKSLNKAQALNDPQFIFAQQLQQENSHPVTYAENLITQRRVGDQVQFQIAELGIDVVGTIEDVMAVDDDIHRWKGRIEPSSDHSTFSVFQSQKDHYTIVQLHTAQGLYIAEIKNGLGIIQPDRADLDHDQ